MSSPPAAKKMLFKSPSREQQRQSYSQSPSSSQSPTRSSREDITGYIMMVGEVQQGQRNKYFDVILSVAGGRNLTVKVMVIGALKTDFKQYLDKAVQLSSISVPADKQNGVYFYTEKYGSSSSGCPYALSFLRTPLNVTRITDVREEMSNINVKGFLSWISDPEEVNNSTVRNGVIADASGDIMVSIWKLCLINSIKDGEVYMMSSLTPRMWNNALKLNSTSRTIVMRCDADEHMPAKIDLSSYENGTSLQEFVNPEVVSVRIKHVTLCRNNECKQEFEPPANEPFPRCPHCTHKTKRSCLVKKMDCTVILVQDEEDFVLKVSEEVIRSAEELKYVNSSDLENTMLMMKATFRVNLEKKYVQSIKDVQNDLEDIEWENTGLLPEEQNEHSD